MARRASAFSRFLAALPALIGLPGPFGHWKRRTSSLSDLPESIRYDIGVTDTNPGRRGAPRRPGGY
jgi:hypothetical protein